MYKHLLKNLKEDISQKEAFFYDIFKNTENGLHAIHDKLPHIIFSAENPMHPATISLSHEDVLALLKDKGYNAESVKGKYGGKPERSIIIHNPPKNSFRAIKKLVQKLGQDSALFSDGYNHELHYTNGEHVGTHHKGAGTVHLKDEEPDNYTHLSDGTKFRHELDFDNHHKDSKFIQEPAGSVKKNEDYFVGGRYMLKKAEVKKHKLHLAGPDTKLIHFSTKKGLESLDPEHHGVRRIGAEAKQGAPTHRMTFYYAEGVQPESIVTSGAKAKYVVPLGDKKIYDIGTDPEGLRKQAHDKLKEAAAGRQINPGMVYPYEIKDAYHQAIKDAGYHGIFNSSLDDTMSNVVGMFESMTPESEHELHPNDFKKTSAIDHHRTDKKISEAENYEHNNPKFLANLDNKFNE